MDRSALANAFKPVLYEIYNEARTPYYKKINPIYPQICNMRKASEITRSQKVESTAIGIDELPSRSENGAIQDFNPSEGYAVFFAKKNRAVKVPVTYEVSRDWDLSRDFLRTFVAENLPRAVLQTKERMLNDLLLYGGYTSGHISFNNDTPSSASGYGQLCADGKPLFTKSGNDRTAKNGATYYNHIGDLALSFANLKTAHNLKVGTNAFMENGQPFDNGQKKILIVPSVSELTALSIVGSEKDPDNANNTKNPLYNQYKVIASPYLNSNTNIWIIGSAGFGIDFFDAEPTIDFWWDKDTATYKASIMLDLACGVKNWRSFVASYAAVS